MHPYVTAQASTPAMRRGASRLISGAFMLNFHATLFMGNAEEVTRF